MSATKLGVVAEAIATRLRTITDLRVYAYEPRDVEMRAGAAGCTGAAAAAVRGPTRMTRTPPEGAESQLGANDWWVTYVVMFFVGLDDPEIGQADARALLGQAVAAIDADRSLGGAALDASLEEAALSFTSEEERRQMAIWECQVNAWLLI